MFSGFYYLWQTGALGSTLKSYAVSLLLLVYVHQKVVGGFDNCFGLQFHVAH